MSRLEKGVVALEFLILFPLIISLVYAAAVYGVLFSWQVQMQVAVDRASAAALRVDRGKLGADLPVEAAAVLANRAMTGKANEDDPDDQGGPGHLPSFLSGVTHACKPQGGMVQCALKIELKDDGCTGVDGGVKVSGPQQLGFFGGFPPMPSCLSASATVSI